jgi:hypothetical protein
MDRNRTWSPVDVTVQLTSQAGSKEVYLALLDELPDDCRIDFPVVVVSHFAQFFVRNNIVLFELFLFEFIN